MNPVSSLDWQIVNTIATYTATHLWAAVLVSVVAEGLIIIPFLAVLLLWRLPEPVSHRHGNQKAALMAIMVVVLALAGKTLISFILFRDRPFIAHPELAHLPFKVDSASFPSGHTLLAFSIAFSLLQSGHKKTGWWLLALAVLIGVSRVAAGVHYPTDILGGIAVAAVASWYVHREASSIRRYLPNS